MQDRHPHAAGVKLWGGRTTDRPNGLRGQSLGSPAECSAGTGSPAAELPRIDVHPVIFRKTYDEHN